MENCTVVTGSKCIGVILVLLSISGCQALSVTMKPALDSDGELFVYLSSAPQEADRLTFRLDGISALGEDGATFPLSLHLREVKGEGARRERLLASGPLPPGRYKGISVKIKDASLKGEGGEAALLVPEGSLPSGAPFVVSRRRGTVLSFSLMYGESVVGGFRFLPVFDVAVRGKLPAGLNGFATSRGGNTVTMFDKISGQVYGVIPTGASPAGMALDPGKRRAYVAVSGEDAVDVIDVLGGEIVDRLNLTPGDTPLELALTRGGGKLLSVNSGSNTVSIIDPSALIEEVRIPVGLGPRSLVVDRAGMKAYVLNASSGNITVLDIPGRRAVTTIVTEAEPVSVDLNRNGSRMYVAHRSSPYISVIDTSSLSIVRKIYVGMGAIALKVDSRTDWIYLSRSRSGRIEVFDPFSSLPIDFLHSEEEVAAMAIDGEGNNLFLVLPEIRAIRGIRLVGKEMIAQIDVGEDPYRVILMGER